MKDTVREAVCWQLTNRGDVNILAFMSLYTVDAVLCNIFLCRPAIKVVIRRKLKVKSSYTYEGKTLLYTGKKTHLFLQEGDYES